jgi:hypothetical protein
MADIIIAIALMCQTPSGWTNVAIIRKDQVSCQRQLITCVDRANLSSYLPYERLIICVSNKDYK